LEDLELRSKSSDGTAASKMEHVRIEEFIADDVVVSQNKLPSPIDCVKQRY
jgi:hypothetical protein